MVFQRGKLEAAAWSRVVTRLDRGVTATQPRLLIVNRCGPISVAMLNHVDEEIMFKAVVVLSNGQITFPRLNISRA